MLQHVVLPYVRFYVYQSPCPSSCVMYFQWSLLPYFLSIHLASHQTQTDPKEPCTEVKWEKALQVQHEKS